MIINAVDLCHLSLKTYVESIIIPLGLRFYYKLTYTLGKAVMQTFSLIQAANHVF